MMGDLAKNPIEIFFVKCSKAGKYGRTS